MKRKFTKFLLVVIMTLTSIAASAYDIEVDGIYFNINVSNKTAIVTSGDIKYEGSIVIPSYIVYSNQNLPVSSIGVDAFKKSTELTSVKIPTSVTSIGRNAFSGCSSLVSIDIPDSVTSLGEYAFALCTSLTSVDIPNSVTSIGEGAFYLCSSLVSIDIPNSVTSIGGSTFSGCSSLVSIDIPNTVTSIGRNAFSGCSSLVSIDIPNSVTSIGESAFSGCISLVSIDIPNSVTSSIGKKAFYECRSLVSVSIPNSVTSLGEYAFELCTSLTSVDIPNSVTYIGKCAFSGCGNLKKIVIAGSVTSIGYETFRGCRNLEEVVFEDSDVSLNFITDIDNDWGQFSVFKDSPLKVVYLGRNLNRDKEDPNYNNWNSIYSPFFYNQNIEIFSIGSHVLRCRSLLFDKCENLQTINCYSLNPPQILNATTAQYTQVIVNIPKGTLDTYQKNYYWKNFWNLDETLPSPEVMAQQILLNVEETELNIGETVQLEATVLPEDTTDQTIIWSSSDEEVAIVSGNGLVTAISRGETIITATCGEVKDTCLITVFEQIKLNLESAELNVGESVQLEATINTEDSNDKSLIWESSDETVASVNQGGLVKGLSEGRAIITATYNDISASCQITVFGDKVYLVGSPVDWDVYGSNLYLSKINSDENIYSGTIELRNSADFRFYRLLGNWDEYYIGSMIEDMPLEIDFKSGEYIGNCFKGKGRWELDNWSGGKVTITLNLDEMDIQFIVKNEEETEQPDDTGIESLLAYPNSNISIYTTDGILIKKDCKVDDLKTLNKGIYIIVSGKEHYKISI